MNRRDFLKVSGLVSVFAYVTASSVGYLTKLPVEIAAFGNIYRGTRDGNIDVSKDGGKSWQLHTKLGSDYSILDLFVGLDGRLYVHTGFQQRSFHLILAQNKTDWLSQVI